MRTIHSINDLKQELNGNEYTNLSNFISEASDFFITTIEESISDKEAIEGYYDEFGLNVGECKHDKVKTESYFIEELQTSVDVVYLEAYIDSGVPQEDYFQGYIITED